MSYHTDDYLHEQEDASCISRRPKNVTHLCALCEHPVEDGNWKEVEVINVQEQVMYVTVCNWCAQLVKETFAE